MKQLHFIGFLLLPFYCFTQNLVPNSGFEACNFQPTSMLDSGHEFEKSIKYWSTANLASTDLITPRFKTTKFKAIPAHNGRNMAGIVIHGDFWSEYVRVQLKDSLKIGKEYYVEFWIAYCRDYHKDDKERRLNPYFGAYFGEKYFKKENNILHFKPQIYDEQARQLNPNEWVKISGSFVAQAAVNYLYIGQFYEAAVNNDILLGYYYLDDVLVEKFSDRAAIYTPENSAPDGLNNIYFETDKYNLLSPSYATLDKIVTYLERNPSLNIQMIGHTDNEGEFYHNQELSVNRAKAVYNYLIKNGIAAKRLKYTGKGSSNPIANNGNEYGRQQNRRVEFLASNALVADQSLDKVNVAESDLVYTFANKNNKKQGRKLGKVNFWDCNEGKSPQSPNRNAKEKLQLYIRKDAKDYLLKRTKNEQIVCFNDAQEHPQTRVFFTELLKDFKQQGFDLLAIEALDYYDKTLNSRGYPSINSGNETDEPVFGALIRTALELGFKVLPYAAKETQINKAKTIIQREKQLSKDPHNVQLSAENWAQAMNLNAILKKNTGSKMLVYAKDKKIREQNIAGVQYMGTWLKRFTKINPLTVEQATMNEMCYNAEEALYYTAKVNKPTIFARDNKVLVLEERDPFSNEALISYDIQIYHPRTKRLHQRPTYLNPKQNKKTYSINLDKYSMTHPCLVMAYNKVEDIEIAIPVDIVDTPQGVRKPTLLLAPGAYTILLRDKKKRKLLDVIIE